MKRVSYKVGTLECEIALSIDNNHQDHNPFYGWFFGWRRTFIIDNIEIMDFILSETEIGIINQITFDKQSSI